MALTQAQGLLLSNDFLLAQYLEQSPLVTQLAARFPFFTLGVQPDGSTHGNSAGGNLWRVANTKVGVSGSVGFGPPPIPLSQAVPVNFEYTLGLLGEAFTINYATQDTQSDVFNQYLAQKYYAGRGLHYGFWRQFIEGNPANPGEFQGLRDIINQPAFANQIIDLAGGPLTTQALSDARSRVTNREGYAEVAYTSSEGLTAIEQAFLAQGALPPIAPFQVTDGLGGTKTYNKAHAFGAEILTSAFVPVIPGPTNLTEIWFMNLGQGAVHGFCPPMVGGSMVRERSVDLGPTEPATQHSYTWPSGIVVSTVTCISVVQNFTV